MTDKWTDRLRTEMEDFQSTDIPEGLWEGIEQKLDAKPVVSSPWRRYAAAAAILLICGSIGITLMHDATDVPSSVGNSVTHLAHNKPMRATLPEDTYLAELNAAHKPAKQISYKCPEPIRCGEELPEHVPAPSANPADSQQDVTHPSPNTHHPTPITQHPSPTTQHPSPTTQHPSTNTQHPSPTTHHPSPTTQHPSPLSARVFTAMSAQGDASARQGYMALSADGVPDNERPMFSKSPFGKLDKLYLANALDTDEEVVSEAKHSLPVRLGVSIGYDIDSRWTLNAGMAYTKLHSTLTSGTSASHFTNNQDIHYLGVPVSMHYNIMNTHRLRLYGAAGAMVEFGVKGKVEVTNVTKGKVVSVEHNSVTDIPVQYSANAALGAEYVMLHGIGIYAEPGLSYYFRNNSSLSTIYSAHPLNFSLQLGVRWNIIQR